MEPIKTVELIDLGLKDVYVDMNNGVLGTFFAKEGEVNSRGLRIHVLNKGENVDCTGIDLLFYGRTSDDKVYERACEPVDLEGGVYQVVYPSNMFTSGPVDAELRLYKGESNISTKTFSIDIDSAVISDDLIEGIDEPDLIDKLLEAARKEKERQYNEIIRQENELVRIENEIERSESELIREESEIERIEGESIRKENEVIRVENEIERVEWFDEVKDKFVDDSELSYMGKIVISEAIDEKGVPSTPEDTFIEMADQIRDIHTITVNGIRDLGSSFTGATVDNLNLMFIDTSKLWNMNRIFNSAIINTIDLSKNDLHALSDIDYMFANSKINKLITSKINPLLLRTTNYLFDGAEINDIDISFINTGRVTHMNYMFRDSLINNGVIDLINLDTSSCLSMNNMFQNCRSSIINSETLDMHKVTSATNMFNNFNSSKSDKITLRNISNSLGWTSAFANSELDSVSLSGEAREVGGIASMNSIFSGSVINNIDLSELSIILSIGNTSTRSLNNMFSSCKVENLRLFNLSCRSNAIKANLSYMFLNTDTKVLDLSTFDMSGFISNNITTTGMFQGCTATIGYARTQSDADIFNASSNKPAALTFVVKP